MTKPTVFVLDDSPPILLTLRELFADEGWEVVATDAWAEVSSGIFARKGCPLVLVCDLNMPGIRGEDYCATVRRYRPDVRIVIFSGDSMAQEAARRLAAPCVSKSAGPEAILAAVRQAVG